MHTCVDFFLESIEDIEFVSDYANLLFVAK